MKSMREYSWAALTPELLVSDIHKSLNFWRDVLGFEVVFDRLEKNFVYLEYYGAQIMLDQRHGHWETGEMEAPFGRGINLQIMTEELDALKMRLEGASTAIYEERDASYITGDMASECREILVQDPDGYLLRFSQEVTKAVVI